MWPGFCENMRVLEWIVGRCKGEVGAVETAIGYLPLSGDLNLDGLDFDPAVLAELLTVDQEGYRAEVAQFREYLLEYGDHLPPQMLEELDVTAQLLDM